NVLTCASVNRGSLRNSPNRGSANHGGISRFMVLFLMARAHGRTSLYDIKDIGAIWFGRWHRTQLSKTMGATSLLNVGVAAVWALIPPPAARASTTIAPVRIDRMTFISLLLLSEAGCLGVPCDPED